MSIYLYEDLTKMRGLQREPYDIAHKNATRFCTECLRLNDRHNKCSSIFGFNA